jgi:hypothetical protein
MENMEWGEGGLERYGVGEMKETRVDVAILA